MKFYILSFFFLCGCAITAQATENIVLNHSYVLSPSDPALEKLKGPMQIATFSDSRNVENHQLITADVQAEAPIAEIISAAFVQAFEENGAPLLKDDARFTLEGELTELNTSAKDGGVEVQLRAKVILKDSGRVLWENILFSRSASENLADAMRASINKLVRELLLDDYFLMEII